MRHKWISHACDAIVWWACVRTTTVIHFQFLFFTSLHYVIGFIFFSSSSSSSLFGSFLFGKEKIASEHFLWFGSGEYYKFCTHHRQYILIKYVYTIHIIAAHQNIFRRLYLLYWCAQYGLLYFVFLHFQCMERQTKNPNISHTHFFKAKPMVKKESETLSQHQQQQMRIESLVCRHFGVQCIHRRHTFAIDVSYLTTTAHAICIYVIKSTFNIQLNNTNGHFSGTVSQSMEINFCSSRYNHLHRIQRALNN